MNNNLKPSLLKFNLSQSICIYKFGVELQINQVCDPHRENTIDHIFIQTR